MSVGVAVGVAAGTKEISVVSLDSDSMKSSEPSREVAQPTLKSSSRSSKTLTSSACAEPTACRHTWLGLRLGLG